MTKTMTEPQASPSHVGDGVGGRMWLFALMFVLILSTMAAQYVVYQRLLEAYSSINQLKLEAASLRSHIIRQEEWKEKQ